MNVYCQGLFHSKGTGQQLSLLLLWVSWSYFCDSLAATLESVVSLNWPFLFLQTLSLEAPARIKNKAPSPDWPQEGEITFENAEMRYQENLPLVLKKVSFTIKPKEKIGIVGRTGSGKNHLSEETFKSTRVKFRAHDLLFIEYHCHLFKPDSC